MSQQRHNFRIDIKFFDAHVGSLLFERRTGFAPLHPYSILAAHHVALVVLALLIGKALLHHLNQRIVVLGQVNDFVLLNTEIVQVYIIVFPNFRQQGVTLFLRNVSVI